MGDPTTSDPSSHYTHLILGTSLPLSILSASLSLLPEANVLHVDPNDYYGSVNASLTLTQLAAWISKQADTSHDRPSSHIAFPSYQSEGSSSGVDGLPAELAALDRHYSISISPSLQAGVSPSLDALIRSGVANYATFRLLQRTALWDPDQGALRAVPSSKEDIFKAPAQELTLLDKRKVMKFLQFCAQEELEQDPIFAQASSVQQHLSIEEFLGSKFAIRGKLKDAVVYGIALCSDAEQEAACPVLMRIRNHLRSTGRYGNSAYLVPQYGGAGELAQGYCRVAAVHGATFVLGKEMQKLEQSGDDGRWKLQVEDIEETFEADQVIAEERILSELGLGAATSPAASTSAARTMQVVFVLDRGLKIPSTAKPQAEPNQGGEGAAQDASVGEESPIETGLIVFPPRSLSGKNATTVTALVLGEGTFCCPKGQYVIHCTTSVPSGESQGATDTFALVKAKVIELAQASEAEWRPSSKTDSDGDAAIPLVEAWWIQDDVNTRTARLSTSSSTVEASSAAGLPASSVSAPSLTTLLDDATRQAEAEFYALHGIQDPPYPDPRRRTAGGRRIRSAADYRGRAGAGPDYSDDEGEEGDENQQQVQPLFFAQNEDDGDESE
ncbi:unnamed protein product [Jaminaea pallidilutea]